MKAAAWLKNVAEGATFHAISVGSATAANAQAIASGPAEAVGSPTSAEFEA
jgi:hypothetical protein